MKGARAFSRRASEMVVVDASEFGAEGFDPKLWINAALDARHPSAPLDRFLADAEERLRSAADDAAAALERDSGDALRRVPLACRDALRLRDDAVALRSHLASVLQSLSLVRASVPVACSLLDLDLTRTPVRLLREIETD